MKYPLWEIDRTSCSEGKCTVWIATLIFLSSLFTSMTLKALFFNIFYEQCKGSIIPESLDITLQESPERSPSVNMDVVRLLETAGLLVCDRSPWGRWLPVSGTLAPGLNPSLRFGLWWRPTACADHSRLPCTLRYDRLSKYVGGGQMYNLLSHTYPEEWRSLISKTYRHRTGHSIYLLHNVLLWHLWLNSENSSSLGKGCHGVINYFSQLFPS